MDRRRTTVVVVFTAIILLTTGVGLVAAGGSTGYGSDADDGTLQSLSPEDVSTDDPPAEGGENGHDADNESTENDGEAGSDSEESASESGAVDNASDDQDDPAEEDTTTIADDPIGVVQGVQYNDTIEVNQSDGLSSAELEAYIHRSMARVEHLRELNFQRPVGVEVLTRDEYRDLDANRSVNESFRTWNNVVWQAMFIVDRESNVSETLDTVRGEAVAGYYDTATGNITIVTDDPDQPTIDNATLVHELTHALQDQHFDLGDDRFTGETQDGELGRLGLIEGDAEYTMQQYVDRCEADWECVGTPSADVEPTTSDGNAGVWAVLYQPYADGPAYVHDIVSTEGWEGLNERYEEPPVTSREIIHRESFSYEPMRFEDSSDTNWTTFPDHGRNGTDRVGEASLFAMLLHQNVAYGVDSYDVVGTFTLDVHPYSSYNYVTRGTDGWTDDVLVPYYNEERDTVGYVWTLSWEDPVEATAFKRRYDTILGAHGGERFDRSTWRIREGGYSGAYRIDRNGSTVTIVHGPDVRSLNQLRPSLEPEPTPPRISDNLLDPYQPVEPVDFDNEFAEMEPTPSRAGDGERVPLPGFGPLVAGLALLGVGYLAARRGS